MPSVLIVDDHMLVRQGLKLTLREEFRDLVLGEAKNSEEAAIRLAKRHWDIVIVDIALPGKDGFSVLQEIRSVRPSARVLVLSMHADPQDAARSRQMGACGYVGKSAGRADLLRAFRNVLAGKEHFADLPSLETVGGAVPKQAALSAREYAVILGFAAGKRSGEIARELQLSVKTVSTYKRRILDKLGLHSTGDLVRYAIDHKLG